MKVLIDQSFEKDTVKVHDSNLRHAIAECLNEVLSAKKLSEITNCKKLKGHKNAYRIKIRDYRIGFIFENQTVELIRFLHRSKIYEYFPD
jgi:mRNA interferase RelE/StbE